MSLRRLGALLALGVLAACARPNFEGTALLPVRPAPPIALTASSGSPWLLAGQTGKTLALFFGYTHCADTCPVTLAKIVAARKAVDPSGAHTEIVFLTVDPQRDTPQILAAYLKRFGTGIVGLTGTTRSIAAVERSYGIWAARIPGNHGRYGYDEAHASSIFLIGPRGNERVLHDASDSVASIAHDMGLLAG